MKERRAAVVFAVLWLVALCIAPLAAQTPDAYKLGEDSAEVALLEDALKLWTGDLDGMVERRMIRIAIPYGIATYFLDGADQKGITYDLALAFEKSLKKQLGLKDTDLTMVSFSLRRKCAACSGRKACRSPSCILRRRSDPMMGTTGGCEPLLTLDGLRMAAKPMYFSHRKAEQHLGYRPRAAELAIADAVEWFERQGYLGRTRRERGNGV